MSQALYRKYRSKSLAEIVGQEHVTRVLAQAIAKGKIAHAYLLTGPRGVGKTSIARILAHEINQLPYDDNSHHLDIIEIDAASNNGVEDVRELREKVQIAPVSAKKKVYIIDEVHMLSKAAFNALLKTLEEPPHHVVFILATTDVDKLPQTIISRTQRFSFRAIAPADAVKHLAHIAKEEDLAIEPDALELIATRGDGSFRDSISLLDQLSGLAGDKPITRQIVEQSLGLAAAEQVTDLLTAYESKDLGKIVELLTKSENAGIQPEVLTSQLIDAVKLQLLEKPQFIPLLDALLEVTKSSKPSVKLLVVLASHTAPTKPKSAALRSPNPVISASVETLQKQPVVKAQKNPLGTDSLAPKTQSAKPPQQEAVEPPVQETSQIHVAASGELDWSKLIEHTRQHFVAIYSVLAKCGHEFDGQTLTIYTGNAFYKKKLDDAKYRVSLSKSLLEVGAGEPTIETVPTPPPPKDSLAASVAAIMGGGEEVSIGEEASASA